MNRARSSPASTFSAIFAASRATRSRHLRPHTAAPVTYQSSRVGAFFARSAIILRRGGHSSRGEAGIHCATARHLTVIPIRVKTFNSRRDSVARDSHHANPEHTR
ncbi:hypothetical protein K523DRAFT_43339 [Schizophyllum commune Tattone D]|nr:hypothetical protein K523DRAFT_43339 [Schizophyllum commune Tattone D]